MKISASNNSRWGMILHNTFLINVIDQVGFVPKIVFLELFQVAGSIHTPQMQKLI